MNAADCLGNPSTASVTYTVAVGGEPGRMHGEGHVEHGDVKHHFTFRVSEREIGEERGSLRYWFEEKPAKGRSRRHRLDAWTIASVTFSNDPAFQPGRRPRPTVDTVVFTGPGRWDGADGYTFEARAVDAAEPGRGAREALT